MKNALLTGALIGMAALPAWAQNVEIRGSCHDLSADAATGAGAEYVGGRDVHGSPVAPADLNKNMNTIHYPIEIPVEVDTLRLLGFVEPDAGAQTIEVKTVPTTLMVYEDGRIEYNGQDISDRATFVCDDKVSNDMEKSTESAGSEATGAPAELTSRPEPIKAEAGAAAGPAANEATTEEKSPE